MKFTPEELERYMDVLQTEEKEIRIDRGRRYGGTEDTLANIAEFGSDGAIVHLWECFRRINNNPSVEPIIKLGLEALAEKVRNMYGKAKNLEDLKNAVQDLRNYAAYIYILEVR